MARERRAHAMSGPPLFRRLVDKIGDDRHCGRASSYWLISWAICISGPGHPLGQHQEREQSADIHRIVAGHRQIDADGVRAADREPFERPAPRRGETALPSPSAKRALATFAQQHVP